MKVREQYFFHTMHRKIDPRAGTTTQTQSFCLHTALKLVCSLLDDVSTWRSKTCNIKREARKLM